MGALGRLDHAPLNRAPRSKIPRPPTIPLPHREQKGRKWGISQGLYASSNGSGYGVVGDDYSNGFRIRSLWEKFGHNERVVRLLQRKGQYCAFPLDEWNLLHGHGGLPLGYPPEKKVHALVGSLETLSIRPARRYRRRNCVVPQGRARCLPRRLELHHQAAHRATVTRRLSRSQALSAGMFARSAYSPPLFASGAPSVSTPPQYPCWHFGCIAGIGKEHPHAKTETLPEPKGVFDTSAIYWAMAFFPINCIGEGGQSHARFAIISGEYI